MAGLYFEEFFIGQKVVTVGRTVTETDIVNFAGLSGDYNQIHTDAEYSKTTPVGQRIAHGLLVPSRIPVRMARPEAMEATRRPCAIRCPTGVVLLYSASVWI